MTENVGLKSETVKAARNGVSALSSEKQKPSWIDRPCQRDENREQVFRAQLESMEGPEFQQYVTEFIHSLPDTQQKQLNVHFSKLAAQYGNNQSGFIAEVTTFLVEKGMYYQQAAEALVTARDAYDESVRFSLEGRGPTSQFIGTVFERQGRDQSMLAILLKAGNYNEAAQVSEPAVRHTLVATNQPHSMATLLDSCRRADGTIDVVSVQREIAEQLPENARNKPSVLPEFALANGILTHHIYVLSGEEVVTEDMQRLKILTDAERIRTCDATKGMFLSTLADRQSLFVTNYKEDERNEWKKSAQTAIASVLSSTDPEIVKEREELLNKAILNVRALDIRNISRYKNFSIERFQEAYEAVEKDLRKVPFEGVNAAEAALVLYFESLSAMVQKNALKQQSVLRQSISESTEFYNQLEAQLSNWRMYFAQTIYTANELARFDPLKSERSANCDLAWKKLGWAMSDYYSAAVWLTQDGIQVSKQQIAINAS